MSLVPTLVVRDEVDIVGHRIANHLDAGIDFSTFCISLERRREALPQT